MAGTSSSPTTGQSVFSLDTQAGVMHLLASIRASELSVSDKNELRDLVFLYTNGGHDESVRLTLEQKLQTHAVKPVAKKTAAADSQSAAAERPAIGNFRQAPSFSVSPETKSDSQPVAPSEPATPAPAPEAKTEVAPAAPVTPAPQAAPAPAPQPTPAPEPTPAVATAPAAASESPEASLERIKEIKSLVNQKIGNPVHLVDTNPEVGREYMSALLEAMKKINSGSSAVAAMERLEAAFEMIAKLPDNLQAAQPQTPPTPPAPTAPVSDVSKAANRARVLDEEADAEPVPAAPTPPPAPAKEAAAPAAPITPVAPATQPPIVGTPEYRAATNTTANSTPPTTEQKPVKVPIQAARQDRETPSNLPISSSKPSGFATDGHDERTAKDSLPLGEPAQPTPPPVSPADTLSNPLVRGTAKAETPGADSLHTAEVDAGLEQLLEEWPIFKKSGLFGTGPKGREHPLFKKLAGLQIPLLLAGRFEGATQEIKQSITDYMNGWRYEQGIIYEQGETFEHYLRRVIRHILDLQKNRM